jgi:hypothetical protein
MIVAVHTPLLGSLFVFRVRPRFVVWIRTFELACSNIEPESRSVHKLNTT